MSRRHRLIQLFTLYFLSIVLIFFLTPIPKEYPSISYYTFVESLKNKEISTVSYSAEDNFAIVRNSVDDKEYKLSIISKESFESDIYTYSLSSEDFVFQHYEAPVQLSNFATIIIEFVFIMIGYFIWNLVYKKIQSSREKNKVTFKENKKGRRDDKSKVFNGGNLNLLGGFLPRMVEDTGVTFKDVIGLDKQMAELQDIVRFLKEPEKYEEKGATLPKGILLFGQPGVGKTHIARAIAGEAEVPFFELSASEINAKYLGESEERVRSIFDAAARRAPAIIYIDEIDSIAVQRFSDNSNKYGASILNQLLSCMDGFTKDSGVIVMASTNNADVLDPALMRRFNMKLYIHMPDKEARRQLVDYFSQGKKIGENVSLERLVDITAGLTGADIETIMNEAAILSVRKNEEYISEETIIEAFRKIEIGIQNSYMHKSRKRLKRTAFHESGHAIVSKYFGKTVSEVSIISRGDTAGYNLSAPDESREYNFKEMKSKIVVLLAGRAAEEEIYKDTSAGASNDLERASSMVRDMFLRYSMRDEDGVNMVLTDNKDLNDAIVKESYEKMNAFLKSCYDEAKRILSEKRPLLIKLSKALMEKETLSENELDKIVRS